MKKIAVVFISLTGNTEAMADKVIGALESRADVSVFDLSTVAFKDASLFDAIAFGCPAMGDEVLEEDTFEPMFASIEAQLAGKSVALFGSYDWGDGQWMRDWAERTKATGAILTLDPVIAQEGGDDVTTSELAELAESLL